MTKHNYSNPLFIIIGLIMINTYVTHADENVYGTADPYLAPVNALSTSVDLFTGDFITSLNLLTLSGRGGISFSLSLIYNSNIEDVWNAANQDRQASNVGLGWKLDIPAIVGSPYWIDVNTIDYYKLWFVSGGRGNELIRTASTTYKLKEYKFWNITTRLASANSWDIISWEIIDENGTKFTFGHKCERPTRIKDANCNPDALLNYKQIGYRWNLTKIEDVFGNTITFVYLDPNQSGNEDLTENVSDYIKDDVYCNTSINYAYTSYTKAYYIDKIIDDTSGRTIKFYWEPRTDFQDDREGPGVLTDSNNNGDGNVEIFNKRRLKEIKLFDQDPDIYTSAACVAHIKFQYDYYSNGSYDKLVLTEIQRLDANNSGNQLPSYKFAYKQFGTNGYNHGALEYITMPDGGTKNIVYTPKGCGKGFAVDRIDMNDGMGNISTFDYTWGNSYSYQNSTFCGHDWVEIDLPGSSNGKIKYTHETQESTNLLGTLKSIENFPEGSTTSIQSVTYTWTAIDKGNGSYFKEISNVTTFF